MATTRRHRKLATLARAKTPRSCAIAALAVTLAIVSACAPKPTPLPTTPAMTPAPTILPSPTAMLPSSTPVPTARPTATTTPLPTATATAQPTATPMPTVVPPTAAPTATATFVQIPQFRALVVSPSEERTLYAVVDDHAYSSTNAGATWVPLGTSGIAPGSRLFTLALDYRNPSVLYAATSAGIYRRTGRSAWEFVHPLNAQALAVDFTDSNTLWAGVSWTTEYSAVILKSTDSGRTWGKADFGIQAYLGYGVTSILIDPTNPDILYANLRYGGRFGWPEGWLYRGGRGGTWEPIALGPQPEGPQGIEGACMAHGLAFDPSLRRLYVGCDAYYYNRSSLFMLWSDNAHAPNAQDILWRQTLAQGTLTPPFAVGFVAPLAVDARPPKSVYAVVSGTSAASDQPYRLLVSHDDGQTWAELPMPGLQ